jgi:hypothetical protein
MAPRVFYRVEDEDSSARYIAGKGIIAGDEKTVVRFANQGAALRAQVDQHLDWSNRNPTPFISTYCEESVAWEEVERRVKRGKKDVIIYKIDMDDTFERVQYRDVRLLAKKLDLWITDDAWHNSKHEWIFLHRVPENAVVGIKRGG